VNNAENDLIFENYYNSRSLNGDSPGTNGDSPLKGKRTDDETVNKKMAAVYDKLYKNYERLPDFYKSLHEYIDQGMEPLMVLRHLFLYASDTLRAPDTEPGEIGIYYEDIPEALLNRLPPYDEWPMALQSRINRRPRTNRRPPDSADPADYWKTS